MDAYRGENGTIAGEEGVVLPMLTPRAGYQAIPRRYEDTKLVINQDFTHKKILGNCMSVNIYLEFLPVMIYFLQ